MRMTVNLLTHWHPVNKGGEMIHRYLLVCNAASAVLLHNAGMTSASKKSGRQTKFAVGTRVRTYPGQAAENPTATSARSAAGTIRQEFSDSLAEPEKFGRNWAITKRWAVALDSGSLVFRNDDELDAE